MFVLAGSIDSYLELASILAIFVGNVRRMYSVVCLYMGIAFATMGFKDVGDY